MNIILATTSPYRKKAFEEAGIDFIGEGSNIDEQFEGRPDEPEDLVKLLSRLKAESVAKNHSKGIIIGFDSVGGYNQCIHPRESIILEKPKSKKEAFKRLKSLSGRTHQFYTGIHMINLDADNIATAVIKTEIFMRPISDKEIHIYLDRDSRYNTYALGYDPLGNYSSTFIHRIVGSYNNITRGIPIETVVEMLFSMGYEI